jgi:hypothetical protein
MQISKGIIATGAVGAIAAACVAVGAARASGRATSNESAPAPAPADADAVPAGFVRADGTRFVVDGATFRPFGFNHTFGNMLGTIDYFHDPTPAGRARVRSDFEAAHRMGANTLRVFLELHDFVERDESTGAVTVREDRLRALDNVLEDAERTGIKLDITGNLAWKADSTPEWYDSMSNRERWSVQAEFWRGVARTAADSPAVLCYELTSEPTISTDPSAPWYGGELGGLHFVQTMARGVEQARQGETMVQWTRTLRDAIRSEDPHHLVTVGMLPFYGGSAGAKNLADELDMLVVHDYPKITAGDDSGLEKSIELARRYASHGKPVMLGETFSLHSGVDGMARYLRATKPYFAGTLSFFDGRSLDQLPNTTLPEAIFRANLEGYLSLRDELTR